MIKTLRLYNFKAFQDTGDIELKPITVLAGPNSGGKSSIIQSLLLLKQTLETESPAVDLNLDGRFLQFSGLNDLTFCKPPLENCRLGYQVRIETDVPTKALHGYFPDLVMPKGVESLPLQSNIRFSFCCRDLEEGKRQIVMDCFEILSQVEGLSGPRLTIDLNAEQYRVKMEGKGIKLPRPYQKRKVINAGGRHFLPDFLVLEPDPEKGERRSPVIGLDPIFWNPLREFEYEVEKHIKYLGPLREEPRRAYLHSGSPLPEIGQRGEYAAQMLWLEKDSKVQYLPDLSQEVGEFTLIEAVNNVFQNLGIDHRVNVRSEQAVMYQILFGLRGSESGEQVTIADVGFGVSQLLPIVVMGLRSPKSSLLLFEQPEIHLHPKLQANLADFFLTLALSGKRLLIETHSDHFINRLRRRIAEDRTDELKEKVNILFVRPPYNGQGAVVEPLKVDRYGVIENWPPEFLPESADEAEAIFRAGLEKRRGQ